MRLRQLTHQFTSKKSNSLYTDWLATKTVKQFETQQGKSIQDQHGGGEIIQICFETETEVKHKTEHLVLMWSMQKPHKHDKMSVCAAGCCVNREAL